MLFFVRGGFALRDDSGRNFGPGQRLIAMVGTVNIPIIKYSVEWWNALHQPASFGLTQKPTMPSEMWLPLLVMVLGFYCFAGFIVLLRMRSEILQRESNARWARDWIVRRGFS